MNEILEIKKTLTLVKLPRRIETFFVTENGVQITKTAKADQEYDIMRGDVRIGSTSKGWTRNGGAGWVNTYAEAPRMSRMSFAQKNLDDALRAAASAIFNATK
jgi:hypothetical protein